MSRTRIVKGKITEIIARDYNIYSESSIVDNAVEIITDKGAAKGESYGNPEKPSAGEILAKCMVQFRPHASWSGEFGFDWLRTGDTGMKGDKWYKDIMGKYRNSSRALLDLDFGGTFQKDEVEYDKLLKKFYNLTIPWKPKINGNLFLYPIPYMTIYKGATNKLSLKLDIEIAPKKLIIRHNKSPIDKNIYFKFNTNEITINNGKYTLDNFLSITCIKTFNTNQYLEVLADDIVCGKLLILANSSTHQKSAKILFVKVQSSSGSGKIKTGNTTGEAERMKKFMKQSYINADFTNITIDLSNDINFIAKLRSGIDTQQYLDKKLRNARFPDGKVVNDKYDNFYKIYFISEVIKFPDNSYLLGEAEKIESKTVFVLDLKSTAAAAGVPLDAINATATHELLHAIGLYHSFDNDNILTIKLFNTDNIMDYYDKRNTKIPAKQTYKWQWDILRRKI